MGVDACGEKVGIGACSRLEGASVVLADLVEKSVGIVVPCLISRVVEAHLSGRNLNNNISVMSHSLVNIGKGIGEVISEHLISNSWRTEAVELKGSSRIQGPLNVNCSESGQGTTE